MNYIVKLDSVNSADIEIVGGKNASLGEMIQNMTQLGINVPNGFATTASAFKAFISHDNLQEKIYQLLAKLNVQDINLLNKTSKKIHEAILATPFLPEFEQEILQAYSDLKQATVAVRSSATAEDLDDASFAGQQETYLNIKGADNLLKAIKLVYASLFNSRAISYRQHQGFDHQLVSLSVGVQPMIRSDKGASGVMFTLDTESGFDRVILITSSYGLGEAVVQGAVNPDEFYVSKELLDKDKFAILQRKLGQKALKMVYTQDPKPTSSIKTVSVSAKDRGKFSITDDDIQNLAKQAMLLEKHYQKSLDIEWAKDGVTGKLYILQARPETVKSQSHKKQTLERYILKKKGKVLVEGQSVGQRIGKGVARILLDPKEIDVLQPGEVLVTDMTDPDWEPVMKRSAAIVTNRGGRTCHAAIIARELGIPAVIGCGDATKRIKDKEYVTVSCAEGQTGFIYAGDCDFEIVSDAIQNMPDLPLKLCINMGNPDMAFATQFLPNHGVGLARLEFIISNMIGIHPKAALEFDSLPKKLQQTIAKKTSAYANPVEFYIEKLREGISVIAAAFYPKQVIFRFSDFKSNEYANLLGGSLFEPHEENPMIGYRGASRYISEAFRECFKLECLAFQRVHKMGLVNAQVMIPFVRTINELKQSISLIEKFGLKRGENDLKIYMMCEVPSNALLAADFLQYVDGFSIGSNDLTQLTLGLDRDSSLIASLFDERNDAVKSLLQKAIKECVKQNKYIGICGQGPSDYPDFAQWLMREGIQTISLNPDSIVETWLLLAEQFKAKLNVS